MDQKTVEESLEKAIRNLLTNQPNIYNFTSQTNQTEWNLGHHLANEIHKFFADYDCDLDVTKRNFGYKRPDIIIHKRGTNENNLLVIEIKKDGTPSEITEDIEKIKENWFKPGLNYQFGAVINLKSNRGSSIKVFINSNK